MFSQYLEEAVIINYFRGHTGKFLDVGANDGKTFSNTYALSEMGWEGVCVEPDPINLKQLYCNYKNNKKIKIFPYALTDHNGTIDFYTTSKDTIHPFGNATRLFATTESTQVKIWTNDKVEFEKITVQSSDVFNLLNAHKGPFDFISIDVEGKNVEVLKMLPLFELKTKLICVEHQKRIQDVINYCNSHWLRKILYRNDCNIIIGK